MFLKEVFFAHLEQMYFYMLYIIFDQNVVKQCFYEILLQFK